MLAPGDISVPRELIVNFIKMEFVNLKAVSEDLCGLLWGGD
jgi:hypothetical protein